MRVQKNHREARQEGPAWLVELGGWYDHLATAELRAVAGGRVEVVGHRLALVDSALEALLRLGGSRAVHVARGFSDRVTRLPDALAEALRGAFSVRFHDRNRLVGEPDRRRVISQIWSVHPSPSVDLVRPEHEIHVFVQRTGLWFGERVGECAPDLRPGRPRRPFFRSYETPARKARVLVNLSGVRAGERFIDPFCGTGALVIEAEAVGATAVGADIDRSAVFGAARNARADGVASRFVIADARAPFASSEVFGAGATDLPYGSSASRRGANGVALYVETLSALAHTFAEGSRLVVMSLEGDEPPAEPNGWSLEWSCREEARTVVRTISVWRRA